MNKAMYTRDKKPERQHNNTQKMRKHMNNGNETRDKIPEM